MGAFLALLAAISYGTGDFAGGFGGRRGNAALIPIPVQLVGILTAVLAVAVGLGGPLTSSVLFWGAVSGIGSGLGNATLLRGLAGGSMSVVAPLSAVVTSALPALVGMLSGDQLTALGWVGIAAALPAVALTSWSGRVTGFSVSDIGYGLAAGCGFGLLFVALDRAGTGSGAWPLVIGQLVALVVVAALAVRPIRQARRAATSLAIVPTLRWGAVAGALGSAANFLFLQAAGTGQLTVVAVLSGLYPAVTVALAAVVLRERPSRTQLCGLVGTAGSVVCIVTG
jgi:drug/metabolite transporter (DMT)-like permease